ncbi:MAG: hypothetical protein EOQ39_27220 [Mesorhizobium sp.]|nr:MAG: hypothetical protein EOQ37_11860 [Mesorhizobium sp.]RWB11452.1 MAG: hypothetical protein EOQ39_27220 [Mesorhizobium sp.]
MNTDVSELIRAGGWYQGLPPSVLPDPALRCRSGRSSFGKPSSWLSVRCADHFSPPSRGEIGSFSHAASLATSEIGENKTCS